jgi:hypothetical protein
MALAKRFTCGGAVPARRKTAQKALAARPLRHKVTASEHDAEAILPEPRSV